MYNYYYYNYINYWKWVLEMGCILPMFCTVDQLRYTLVVSHRRSRFGALGERNVHANSQRKRNVPIGAVQYRCG